MANRLMATMVVVGVSALATQIARAADVESVTVDNFIRAESDLYFSNILKESGGTGKFSHRREPAAIDQQTVIRLNRDTLYSAAVFDLDAGPVTVMLPDAGDRFMSMLAINEDHYVTAVAYGAGSHTFARDQVGTRYLVLAIRTFVNPADAKDVEQAHALQDAITVEQASQGTFEVPNWDQASQKKVRDALLILSSTIPNFNRAFGAKDEVDPIRHLLGSAAAWGGNPDKDAIYLNVTPDRNDGTTVYKLKVGDVPVDGFWSVSLYNGDGYFAKNPYDSYSINNVTAAKNNDGSIDIQFGGCDGKIANCLPIMKGWNYTVRLYRPRAEILDNSWTFPEPQPEQ
ncbi:carboxylesterase [Ensifer adhaerens]|nr:carboxylesterase [Ensifer adhaerens]